MSRPNASGSLRIPPPREDAGGSHGRWSRVAAYGHAVAEGRREPAFSGGPRPPPGALFHDTPRGLSREFGMEEDMSEETMELVQRD
jgi:hypothetical protein